MISGIDYQELSEPSKIRKGGCGYYYPELDRKGIWGCNLFLILATIFETGYEEK